MFGHFNYSFNYLHLRFVQFYQVVFFIYLNFLFLMQFLKITPHLQLLQNIGYIPHAVQYTFVALYSMGFPGGSVVKCLPAMRETWVRSLSWEDPLERTWQPTQYSLPGKFHGRRSLVSYSPWGYKESDTTEWLHLTFISSSLYLPLNHPYIATPLW